MITSEKKSLNAGRYVDTKYVDTIISTYKKERWVHNSERIGKEDSLTAWINVEELEEFVAKIKMHGGNGIRICFGAYPKDFAENSDLAGRQTVVMVATRSNDYNKSNKDLYVVNDGKANILALGWLPICPPICVNGFTNPGTVLLDGGDKGLSVM
jgi:hypothetical protein